MGIEYPLQHVTMTPFAERLWYKVNQSSAVIYPFLDINTALDATAQVPDALTRPLQGEIYEGDEDDYTVMIGGVGHCQAEGLMDDTSAVGDTTLRISNNDDTSLIVTGGSCLIGGIFVEYIGDSTISIYDVDSYRLGVTDYPDVNPLDYIAGKTYVVCAAFTGDEDSAEASLYLMEINNFILYRDATSGLDHTLIEKSPIALGMYTVNESSLIDEISDEVTIGVDIWKRDIIPQAPSLNPLNGGVVIAAGWEDDWV